ncbi:hypothetical protein [Xanthocytophaga flava]|uniref:hypothetical protein n=1 Tax=Xanthocytophaga flava TaxID=3048013 RepID=UPI0028D135F8|nr:hypothetical protein [Xanthocytophaga flavus]
MFKINTLIEKRVSLLNLHLSELDNSQVQDLTGRINEYYARIFEKRNKPSFENTIFNLTLIQNLADRDLINSFEIIEKKNEIKVIAKYQ